MAHNLLQMQVNINMLAVANLQRAARDAEERDRQAMRRRRRAPRWWVRPSLREDQRLQYGHWNELPRKMRVDDEAGFYNYLRVPPRIFDEIHQRIRGRIERQSTKWRESIETGLKLAATLRHLATGDSYATLQYSFRVSRHTICKFLPLVCEAIFEEYSEEVFTAPDDAAGWREIEERFRTRWNLPHCCGALDGKHVRIQKPSNSGSDYWNYKHYFSVILLALVDADYKFVWADIGAPGHQSDAQVFNRSELARCLSAGVLGLPDDEPLPGSADNRPVPYFMVGDDAFALRTWMVKPYSGPAQDYAQRIASYRISRARRVSENAFGILAKRFQCLLTTLQQQPEVINEMVKAMIVLHNLLRTRFPNNNPQVDREDNRHNVVPGPWRAQRPDRPHLVRDDVLLRLDRRQRRGNPGELIERGRENRDYLKNYFMSEAGRVPWQDRAINPHHLFA